VCASTVQCEEAIPEKIIKWPTGLCPEQGPVLGNEGRNVAYNSGISNHRDSVGSRVVVTSPWFVDEQHLMCSVELKPELEIKVVVVP
jgi:hypothetical protein